MGRGNVEYMNMEKGGTENKNMGKGGAENPTPRNTLFVGPSVTFFTPSNAHQSNL